jgi:hypothetical protein
MATKKKKTMTARKTKASDLNYKPRARGFDKYAEVLKSLETGLRRPGDAVAVAVPAHTTADKFRNALSAVIARRLPKLAAHTRMRVLEGEKEVAVIRK